MNVPFITIEGPIGVGKTTLSQALATHKNFHLLKEIVDENPFLNKFYEDIAEWSFQTEMFFLCNRYKQLTDIKKYILAEKKPVVADYHIFKNLIFAQRTLPASEYEKYEAIYQILTKNMPKPNMVVYLYASVDTLMQRIAMRGRDFERLIERQYMEQLAQDYHDFIDQFERNHPDIPVLRFNGDAIDFVKNHDDLTYVLQQCNQMLEERGCQS